MILLVLGAGYSGKAIARQFLPEARSVTGTTRSAEKAQAMRESGLPTEIFDGNNISPDLAAVMAHTTHLVQSIAPGQDGDPLMRPGCTPLMRLMPALQWVGYLSTVGVYGDHGGGWVDEQTPCRPVSVRSIERVAAEEAWLAFGRDRDLPVSVLRLSGIYGPGRNAFCNLAEGTARRLVKQNQVFNRIRVEDIASATYWLAVRGLGGVYNITDHEPAPPQDVVEEAARLMGVAPPPEIAFETAELSAMARSFYGENKRVCNRRIRDLGFTFRFTDYRISLDQLWRDEIWHG